jgi:hypothetical protein
VRRAYKFRAYPTLPQEGSAGRLLADHCDGCHQCGRRCTRPRQDTVICPVHGQMDADVNGARNVYTRAGLGSGQAVWAA